MDTLLAAVDLEPKSSTVRKRARKAFAAKLPALILRANQRHVHRPRPRFFLRASRVQLLSAGERRRFKDNRWVMRTLRALPW